MFRKILSLDYILKNLNFKFYGILVLRTKFYKWLGQSARRIVLWRLLTVLVEKLEITINSNYHLCK